MTATSSKRRYHGIQNGYRSGLEEAVAEDLKRRGIDARYEEAKIKYVKPSKPSTYTPDFVIERPVRTCPDCGGRGYVEELDGDSRSVDQYPCTRCDRQGTIRPALVIETKGRFVTADRQKHLLVKEQHPDFDVRFVFQNSRARISKTSKTTYAAWCEKHGFKYADKCVPAEWLTEASP